MTLKAWVKENGGLSEVAHKLGVTYFSVRNWMNNGGTPTADTIHRIIKLSKGKLTFEEIYQSARKKKKRSKIIPH